jgi:N-acetyl-D-muramate 6-phosphate phosphatase
MPPKSPNFMPLPQAIFFDLDGTLIDSAPDLGAAADKMRTDRGLPSLPLDLYRPMAGAGARGMLHIGFGMAPTHADFAAMKEEFFQNYEAALTERTRAFDGVAQLLASLQSQGIAWGIVTNKSKRFTDPIARQMPLLHAACAVVSGDTTPHAKPHPAPVLEAARIAGYAPTRCWYVGDDKRDIDAGRAAGMHSIAAAWGYMGEHALDSWGADAVAHAPGDLLAWLVPHLAGAGA